MDTTTKVATAVEAFLRHEGSGHDWQHIYRVWQVAQKLAEEEGANLEIVNLAALLHDVDDYKLTNDPTSEEKLPTARKIMAEAGISEAIIEIVCTTIKMTGFAKSLAGKTERTLEAHILSDADQLDAIGAIAIARVFAYGGHKNRLIFNPEDIPQTQTTRESYVNNNSCGISHFFEKLLKLRHMMFTATSKGEAEIRHKFMVEYLDQFFTEAAAPAIWKERLNQFR